MTSKFWLETTGGVGAVDSTVGIGRGSCSETSEAAGLNFVVLRFFCFDLLGHGLAGSAASGVGFGGAWG